MLKRIDWIKNCGFFETFHWDTSLPDLARGWTRCLPMTGTRRSRQRGVSTKI
ncbi:hypothetical protein FB473_002623 [Brooklawnia cerclae]|uniref:Uncharacterized protein n=1 Tax=Brooklawnia cerclae TaxID=349934 RepID=A0ABX0SHU6_9ACTN|nr:hypothetical protein [Brooklawnia cerclae]